MTEELQEIVQFMKTVHLGEAIPEMEGYLQKAIGYGQRVGELVNIAEHNYATVRAEKLSDLARLEDETETIRKAKLDGWVADDRKLLMDLKNIAYHLKAQKMALMQSIKTKREEPR